ncbi:hypothetical protein B0T14DRAFT_344434 [Immersiella caudata]|uniref:Uncharacterized protein n=1 Tax=Immersiella caudata TaxID=314043 RepID=A0AA39TV84_9PEZI|nr:hypothetical protein B0T14DRAFT_344434 [Immersiella caudata]
MAFLDKRYVGIPLRSAVWLNADLAFFLIQMLLLRPRIVHSTASPAHSRRFKLHTRQALLKSSTEAASLSRRLRPFYCECTLTGCAAGGARKCCSLLALVGDGLIVAATEEDGVG